MINLEEHIVEIEGVKYVTLEIAETAIAANINQSKLDDAMLMIQNSINEINDGINSITEDD
tara:strand:- start:644 stop:826 length:183 start_codon:yes stop_codon:yes gene_type:complete